MSHKSAPSIAVGTIGVDIGKNSFHLVGLDQRGAIVWQLKCSRAQLERRLANIPVLLDRHGSVFWSALHRSPARRAWPRCSFAPGAIREAVPQRSQERLPRCRGDYGSRAAANHALRGDQDAGADGPAGSASRALAPRQPADGVINQIRGFLIERGIIVRQGVLPLRKALPDILSSNTGALSPRMVNLIAELVQDWGRLDERIAGVSAEIEALAEQDEGCQRVMTMPGVGPIISSAVVAAIGNGTGFTQGRDFGAWQESTGDRTILGKISKRGNKYLRTLFVQAAHVLLARRPNAAMRSLWPWIEQASRRLHRNMLAIALAHKLARIAWAVLARGHSYQPRIVADAA